MKCSITLIVLLAIPVLGLSATIEVPADYGTIQEAIDAAGYGDTVLVHPGTYVENINFKGKAVTVMSNDGPSVTVIDGKAAMLPVVRFQNAEGPDSVLEGFTLKNGQGKLFGTERSGGGIICDGASPTIRDNVITENTVDGTGGGICCFFGASPAIVNNIITGNVADNASLLTAGGGIMAAAFSSPAILGNVISGNTALGGVKNTGGGICCDGACYSLISDNCIFGNQANYAGGIMCSNHGSTPTISNNVIYGNTAVYNGGGIICWENVIPAVITNNVIYGNTAQGGEGGGGIMCRSNAAAEVTNTVLWGNKALTGNGPEICVGTAGMTATLTISYSDVEGGKALVHVGTGSTLNWGAGMIDADPLFVDPADGDFHLTFSSPCKDAGDDEASGLPDEDFEKDPRIAYGTVDMGADEFYTHLYWTGDATPGGSAALKLVGLPGTSPVQIWLGSGVMDPPMHTKYGNWCLQFPLLANLGLGSMPSPDGVMVLPFTFPPDTPVPLALPFQAGIGMELTNLSVMKVE